MKTILLALTIDADPDGLSGTVVNRRALNWGSLSRTGELHEALEEAGVRTGVHIPITWFIRADGQLREAFGRSGWLLEERRELWEAAARRGDELGWHPHLYRIGADGEPGLITNPGEAAEEIEEIWGELQDYGFFKPASFRSGEGWHCEETYATAERLGFAFDSTAIPGRRGGRSNPMDWTGAPNEPYYPSESNVKRAGQARGMLEIPLNTWKIQAPYDDGPRVRYMNPAVHEAIFEAGLEGWESAARSVEGEVQAWVLVLHPEETLPGAEDQLYSHSARSTAANLERLYRRARGIADRVEFTTLREAGERWQAQHGTNR